VTNRVLQFPFYAKVSIFLIGLVAFVAILFIARGIILPFVFSVVVAILLHPLVNYLVGLKINRIIAITIALILTSLALAGFFALIFSQVTQFSDSWPKIVDKLSETLNQCISGLAGYLDIKPQIIHDWITKSKGELLHFSNESIEHTILSVGHAVMLLFLIPVYIFFILFYQPLLIEFIHRLFSSTDHHQVSEIVTQIKSVIQRYLVGLVIEAVMVAALDIAALMILGIDYAILLGILGALLNVIPYIGGIVAVALPMMIAIATKSTAWYAFYVMGCYYFIQLIDNHYIIPYIVASKVKINALFSIIVVFVGNAIWGIPGMFLSIPLLAIVKVILDHIESVKPWGFLLGDTMPPIITLTPILKKLKKIAS
jgi:predicted PurR-regulated permease PerM